MIQVQKGSDSDDFSLHNTNKFLTTCSKKGEKVTLKSDETSVKCSEKAVANHVGVYFPERSAFSTKDNSEKAVSSKAAKNLFSENLPVIDKLVQDKSMVLHSEKESILKKKTRDEDLPMIQVQKGSDSDDFSLHNTNKFVTAGSEKGNYVKHDTRKKVQLRSQSVTVFAEVNDFSSNAEENSFDDDESLPIIEIPDLPRNSYCDENFSIIDAGKIIDQHLRGIMSTKTSPIDKTCLSKCEDQNVIIDLVEE